MVLALGSVQSCMATSNKALLSIPGHLRSAHGLNHEKTYKHVPISSWSMTSKAVGGTVACPKSARIRAARRMVVRAKAAGDAPWVSKPAARYVTSRLCYVDG